MADTTQRDPPSGLVAQWAPRLASMLPHPRRALDVAIGKGRHLEALSEAGFQVFGVDIRFDALVAAASRGRAGGAVPCLWCADLSHCRLPNAFFHLVVVTRYLQRDLFHALRDTVHPGGAIIYETFTVEQNRLGRGPTSPAHLLRRGELRGLFEDFEMLYYEEVSEPEALARLVARKRS
jgi:SAM-dependent methyltransferase